MHISILDVRVRAGGDSAGHDADLQYISNTFRGKAISSQCLPRKQGV